MDDRGQRLAQDEDAGDGGGVDGDWPSSRTGDCGGVGKQQLQQETES